MKLVEALQSEFETEVAIARKFLERVPEDKLSWTPHEKSMALDRLASHIAEIPMWTIPTLEQDSLDLAPPGAPPYTPHVAASRKEMLEIFDKNVAAARASLAAVKDDRWTQPWSLLMGGQVLLAEPRIAILRSFVFNHLVHHRAQLGVYLRLNNVAVPSTYGPSADENTM
ncbi:MAG: damage-inducible protein DinB [Acidimicrobiia bacterium]|nr:damage-inducible protein DinB [Acidimicrobiia bacterium]